jgi:hypothetical protein
MISEDELYEITSKADPELFCDFISGFRAAEKIYLQKIKALEEMLESARGVISFYGNPESWIERTSDSWDRSDPRYKGDLEQIRNYKHPKTDWRGTISVGGKRAREWLRQNEREE